MTRHLRRIAGATALGVAVVLLAAAAGTMRAAGAPSVVIYEGDAEAAAVHVRATKESVLPVPDALDTFLPLARVKAASPVLRSAIAAPAFDTNVSNLPELLCTASGNQLCLPSVPLTASAEEPGTSEQTPLPRLSDGPLTIAAGYAEARATSGGASALARNEGLTLRGDGSASNAAGALREAIAAGDPTWRPADADEDALLSTSGATSSSEIVATDAGVAASATSEVGGVSLLGGLIAIESVHTEAAYARPGDAPTGGPRLAGVAVGPFDAVVDDEGVHVTDETLGAGARERLNDVLARADEVFSVRLGGLTVEARPDGRTATATGLEIAYRREVVPNTGAEAVRIGIGTATVAVARSEAGLAGAGAPAMPDAPSGPEAAGDGAGGASAPSAGEAPRRATDPGRVAELAGPDAAPAGNVLPGLPDFPAGMLVLVVAAALAASMGFTLLTGWQVAEE